MSAEFLTFPIRSDKLTMTVKVRSHLYSRKSEFQQIDIYDTEVFGRMLFLDGHVQLSELDECSYHEALVHIPLLAQRAPKRALVIGGGDGGVLRELCKHQTIEHIDMVEIDRAVVEAAREFLPQVSAGAFEDRRVHLHIADAFPYVKAPHEVYDLIIIDATDTYEDEQGELSEMLFTDAFYADCLRLLSDQGFVVTQADNILFCPYSYEEIEANFRRTFPEVGGYWALVPSFGGPSGYAWAGRRRLEIMRSPSEIPGLRTLNDQTLAMAFTSYGFSQNF
ncbi:MAG: hypothetical protein JNM85_02880 [Chthonomonas sp.]|nr:hypothetical protein [Chthonomonas sp.]